MVKINILVVYSFLCSNKRFLENLVHTLHCKLGNKMTASVVSYSFNISMMHTFTISHLVICVLVTPQLFEWLSFWDY
jgi:hypothetical protein